MNVELACAAIALAVCGHALIGRADFARFVGYVCLTVAMLVGFWFVYKAIV